MNRGVELLLKRMDSHPEEFADKRGSPYVEREEGKWDSILYDVFSRIELMDRDNGNGRTDGLVATSGRMGKPLCYLSDEEVMVIFNKLNEVRANLFEARVMDALLSDDNRENRYEWVTKGRDVLNTAHGVVGTVEYS